MLDPGEKHGGSIEALLSTFSAVYKKLTYKEAQLMFPAA